LDASVHIVPNNSYLEITHKKLDMKQLIKLEKILEKEIVLADILGSISSVCVLYCAGQLEKHEQDVKKIARLYYDWLTEQNHN
jgi:hypothetical protein